MLSLIINYDVSFTCCCCDALISAQNTTGLFSEFKQQTLVYSHGMILTSKE